MRSDAPTKLTISEELLADIKSAGHNYFKIRKAIDKAVAKFKNKNLLDQAKTLESYYQENFRALGWSGWIFLFSKDKDAILSELNKKINYLKLYETITTQFAATRGKTTESALDQFYKKLINSTTQPLRSALSNVDQHQAVDKKKNPVLSAIKKFDELKDMAHIKRNLKSMVDYLKLLQHPDYKAEKNQIATLFNKIHYQGVFADFTFDQFIQRLVRDADIANGIEDYATLLGKMQGIEQLVLLFYNQQPDRPPVPPLELKKVPTDVVSATDASPTSLDQKAQTKLATDLKAAAGLHLKKIQQFDVNFLKKGEDIKQIRPHPNQFYLAMQDGEWKLYKANANPKNPPVEVPLHNVPGLKDVLQEEGTPDTTSIKELIFTYFTVEDQKKKFNHFDVEFFVWPRTKDQTFAVRPNKFYLAEQKEGGWKLYIPNKKATDFIEIEISHFPGLQEILDETNHSNVLARKEIIKDFLFQYALSIHSDVYSKIDSLLFNYVNNFIKEVPPDFLKIFIAASLAKNYGNYETAIFDELCTKISGAFPEYKDPEYIAQMMLKKPVYDHVVLDFKKMLLENLDEIEKTFTLKPAEGFTQIRSAAEEKDKTAVSTARLATRNLESLEKDFNAILKKSDRYERKFSQLFPRQWRIFQTTPPVSPEQILANDTTVARLIMKTEKLLEDLVVLQRDAQLASSLSDTPPFLKNIAIATVPKIAEQIKLLEQRLKKYQAQAKITQMEKDKLLEKKIETDLQPLESTQDKPPKDKLPTTTAHTMEPIELKSLEKKPKKTAKVLPKKSAGEHFDKNPQGAKIILALFHQHTAELLRVVNDTRTSHQSSKKDFLDWLQKKVITVEASGKNSESRQIKIKEHYDFDLDQIMMALALAKATLPSKEQNGLRLFQEPHPDEERHKLIMKLYGSLEKSLETPASEKLAAYTEKCAAFMRDHPEAMTIEKFITYCKKEAALDKRASLS